MIKMVQVMNLKFEEYVSLCMFANLSRMYLGNYEAMRMVILSDPYKVIKFHEWNVNI